MSNFTERVVIVTGGSGSLGGAVVTALAEAGASVVVPDRKPDRVTQLFPALAEAGQHLLAGSTDVTKPEGMATLVEQVMNRYGRLDALINTIGGYRAGKVPHETALETWDAMMTLNAKTTLITCQAVIPAMLAGGYGRIVNTAARAALSGRADAVAYSASKAAVIRLTESFAAAYKNQGITVNAILPNIIDTPKNRQAMPKADYSQWVTPQALAQVILFLASEAAGIVNGVSLPV